MTLQKAVPKPTKRARERPSSPARSLRVRLAEAEQALEAISAGEVDALVVPGPAGARVFTLEGADRGYRILMDAMSEGVATVTEQGLISYCNVRFTESSERDRSSPSGTPSPGSWRRRTSHDSRR